jgi:hypothetical protein
MTLRWNVNALMRAERHDDGCIACIACIAQQRIAAPRHLVTSNDRPPVKWGRRRPRLTNTDL